MSATASPSPPPRVGQPSTLLPSSIFSTPSFSSTLPLPRPTSASGAFRRTSRSNEGHDIFSKRRKTRSVATSVSSDGSLGDFSVGNYTIDLAQLSRKNGGAVMIGSKEHMRETQGEKKKDTSDEERVDSDKEEGSDFMGNYVIDLGGFGDKHSSVVVEDKEMEKEEVPSEDDGPEDFTVNLEKWMRGTQRWEKDTDDAPRGFDEPDEILHGDAQGPDADKKPVDESVFEPLATSTPASLPNPDFIEEWTQDKAKQTAPPLSRCNTEKLQDQAAEEVFERISALQAEVERMQVEDQKRQLANRDLELENQQLREDHESMSNQLRRKEQLSQDTGAKFGSLRAKFEPAVQKLAALRAEAETTKITADIKIRGLEGELGTSRDEVRNLRSDMEGKEDAYIFKVNSLHTELEKASSEARLDRGNIEKLESEVEEIAQTNMTKGKQLDGMTGEMKAIKTELGYAQEQVRETRRIVETVEDENDRFEQQNERHTQEIEALNSSLTDQAAKLKDMISAIEQLKASQGPAQSEEKTRPLTDEYTYNAALEKLATQHETALSSLKTNHAEESERLRSALEKAGQEMQKREYQLANSYQVRISTLHQQISNLKKQDLSHSVPPTTTSTEADLSAAIRALSSKLQKANDVLTSAKAEVIIERQRAEAERQRAEDVRQTNAMINAELEARFAETVEAREREWTRRVNLLFRDREKMGKALMCGWGREEVGRTAVRTRDREGGQGYRYKYVKR